MHEERHVDGVGTLSHPGRSRHWTGPVLPVGATDTIVLTVAGTSTGPTPAQVEAIRRTLEGWTTVLADATPGLAWLLDDAGLPQQDPWAAFDLSGLSVPAESYDESGPVHVLIDLEHADHRDDFRPAIDVVDGHVVGVLSGT